MDTLTAIRTRRSVRNFQDRQVSRNMLEAIVDAGRLAATGGGLQPWEFVVVTDAATRARLAELSPYGRFLSEAPAVIIALHSESSPYGKEDCCSATATMLLAIHNLGLGACWVVTDDEAGVLACLGAPEGHHVGTIIALGYPEITPEMPDKRPLRDVLHWEHF